MDISYTFDNATGQFNAVLNGQILASSKNQQYLKQKVKNMGHGVPQPGTSYTPSLPGMPVHPMAAIVAPAAEFTVAERFDFIERFTKGVATGAYLSLVLVGGPGLGKTYTVLDTLRAQGLIEIKPTEVPVAGDDAAADDEIAEKLAGGASGTELAEWYKTDGDFVVIKGFSTPKALYRALFDNNGKIIVLDDADGAFADRNAANILKGALDSSEPRYISWMTEKKGEDDLPTRFEFTGRIIFISNLTLEQFPPAILSRAVHVDLSLTTTEKIERIEDILVKMPDPDGYVDDVLSLIRENAERFKELSVRTAMMLLKIRLAEPNDEMFKRMALYHSVV